jgi:hypothetical protein
MLSIPLRNEKGDPKAPPSPPFYTGPIDDKKTPETTAAIKAYQEDRGILNPGNGFPGEQTRARLFSEYMNAICHDNQGNPFKIAPTDFIARNQDTARQVAGLVPGLRGDVQGCGEFNPVLLLSEKQEEDFKPEEQHKARDEAYAADRRVIVYVFRHGTEIDFNRWPCPLATSRDTVPCTKRFWSDGDDRRGFRHPFRERHWRITGVDEDPDHPFDPDTPDPPDPNDPDKKQRPIEQRDTMACRFYHAFAFQSPCEAGSRLWIVRFLVDGFNNKQVPLSRRRYVLKAGQTDFAPVIRGTLDASGEVRIPVLDEVALMTIKLDVFGKEVPDDDQQSGGGGATKGPVSAKSSSSAPAPQKTADAPKTEAAGDTDRFPDEDRFLTFELDAGALKPMSVEPGTGNRVVAQRLYNLGFGDHAPQDWDNDEFTRAVRDYRRTRNLGDDAKLDRQTRLNIKVDHELGGAPPPDDD